MEAVLRDLGFDLSGIDIVRLSQLRADPNKLRALDVDGCDPGIEWQRNSSSREIEASRLQLGLIDLDLTPLGINPRREKPDRVFKIEDICLLLQDGPFGILNGKRANGAAQGELFFPFQIPLPDA